MVLDHLTQTSVKRLWTTVCHFLLVTLIMAAVTAPYPGWAQSCTPLFKTSDLTDSYFEDTWFYEGLADLFTNFYPPTYAPINDSKYHEFSIYFMGRLRKKSDKTVIGKFFQSELEDKQDQSLTANNKDYAMDLSPMWGSFFDHYKIGGYNVSLTATSGTENLVNLNFVLKRPKGTAYIKKATYSLLSDRVSPVIPPLLVVLIQRRVMRY